MAKWEKDNEYYLKRYRRMSNVERRREWSKLYEAKRESRDDDRKRKLNSLMNIIDRLMDTNDDKKIGKRADQFVVEVHVSVFEQESSYTGPTAYGSSLGDGNYWRKSGHH